MQLLLDTGAKVSKLLTAAATVVMVTQPSQDAVENNCPLHVSCYNGHSDVVMLLVNHPEIKIDQQVYNLVTSLS